MGQEQSAAGSAAAAASPTLSASASPSFSSFLTRKRAPAAAVSQIVTVNNGNAGNSAPGTSGGELKMDEDFRLVREIPRFMPILRDALSGGCSQNRTPSDIFKKIQPRYVFRFLHRLQRHCADCQQVVAGEQTALAGRIQAADQMLGGLVHQLNECGRRYQTFARDIRQTADQANQDIQRVQVQLQLLMAGLETIRYELPPEDRPPTLAAVILPLLPSPKDSAVGRRIPVVEECTVIDQQ